MIDLKQGFFFFFLRLFIPLWPLNSRDNGESSNNFSLKPGFHYCLGGVEEMCYFIWKREERGVECHLVNL